MVRKLFWVWVKGGNVAVLGRVEGRGGGEEGEKTRRARGEERGRRERRRAQVGVGYCMVESRALVLGWLGLWLWVGRWVWLELC